MESCMYSLSRPTRIVSENEIEICYAETQARVTRHLLNINALIKEVMNKTCDFTRLNILLHIECKELLKSFGRENAYWDEDMIDFVMMYPLTYIRRVSDKYEKYESRTEKHPEIRIITELENFNLRLELAKISNNIINDDNDQASSVIPTYSTSPLMDMITTMSETQTTTAMTMEEKMSAIGYEQTKCSIDSENVCAICINNFKKDEETVITKCKFTINKGETISKHVFHKECMMNWFKSLGNTTRTHAYCPVCKSESIKLV